MEPHSSSSSGTSSSSHSSGERHLGMEKFERMHLRSPSSPRFKGKKDRLHRCHFPPPPHHEHHHEHRHHSPPPLLHCEKSKLRVKPPKPSKKVRKLHHKLMKACKLPKGSRHRYYVPPAPEAGLFSADAAYEHSPGCCLHHHGMSMAEGWRPPHEVGVDHHSHLRCRAHKHPHKRHPCVKSEIRRGVSPMLPGHEATATPAEPPIEADAPPQCATMVDADEAAPTTLAA